MTSAAERIAGSPLAVDVRGSSVRVVIAADKYTVANISEGMNDRAEYARLFAAAPDLLRVLQIVRMMIRGEIIEGAVIDRETMQPLGNAIDAAIEAARGKPPR